MTGKQMNKEYIDTWMRGYKNGERSVLEYINDIQGDKFDMEKLRQDYKDWSECDEYTTHDGKVIER